MIHCRFVGGPLDGLERSQVEAPPELSPAPQPRFVMDPANDRLTVQVDAPRCTYQRARQEGAWIVYEAVEAS